MSSGKKVRRSNQNIESNAGPDSEVKVFVSIPDAIYVDGEITPPTFGDSFKLRYAKWKIKMLYFYLAYFSLICVGAVVIAPTSAVRIVVLALWPPTLAAFTILLRREYHREV
ncbi:MAG TPA: hypothetical protein VJ914_09550 [Pseudonocardiaceae bacterium]|nr:hypothetical protein [Pseudonocardiaceae bacterium]